MGFDWRLAVLGEDGGGSGSLDTRSIDGLLLGQFIRAPNNTLGQDDWKLNMCKPQALSKNTEKHLRCDHGDNSQILPSVWSKNKKILEQKFESQNLAEVTPDAELLKFIDKYIKTANKKSFFENTNPAYLQSMTNQAKLEKAKWLRVLVSIESYLLPSHEFFHSRRPPPSPSPLPPPPKPLLIHAPPPYTSPPRPPQPPLNPVKPPPPRPPNLQAP